ncbi:hypothetical protein ACJRO7_014804 [Eucalyptus globulus]|uniref:Uncharacterized protein n=1 Tax=Eucalyptus globulus TaxID=34317 RepID=A0ABD3L237_EUCGL
MCYEAAKIQELTGSSKSNAECSKGKLLIVSVPHDYLATLLSAIMASSAVCMCPAISIDVVSSLGSLPSISFAAFGSHPGTSSAMGD